MKAAKTLEALAEQVLADAARKKDLVIDSRELRVLTSEGGTEVMVPSNGDGMVALAPQPLFLRQLGQHVGVRADLMDRLREQHPIQFDQLVNGLLGRVHLEHDGKAQKRMVRTYTDDGNGGPGVARSLQSDKYRRLDYVDMAQAVVPIIQGIPGAQVPACELTETRMYIKVVAPNTATDLNSLVTGEDEFLEEGPDTVFAGFVISNSEVGAGALKVEHMLYRVRCRNGLIMEQALRRQHVGKAAEVNEDYTIYSDATLAADDKAVMMKVADAVRHAVDETRFMALAQQFADTKATEPMEQPVEQMQVLAQRFDLTDREGASALQHLLKGDDLTQFGAINAITRAAHDVESYDRSVELEQIGAGVMAMPRSEWRELVAA